MYGRRLRTRLDLLKPNIMNNVETNQRKQVKYAGGSERLFVVGERVWVRDFGRNADPYLARRASRTSRSENSRAGNPRLICIPVTSNGPRAWAGSPRARASPPAGRCVLKHATGARSTLKDSYWLHTNHRVGTF
ncbi:hypothetical protein ACJJTC_010750 [Scirpophaga incertulas]